MKRVNIEMTASVTINQYFNVTDEEYEFLKEHEGYTANCYHLKDKEVYQFLEQRLDFDCISEIRNIDLDFVELEEEEEDDSN